MKVAEICCSVTVNDKGEIIIPSRLRKAINIRSGERLVILAGRETGSICLTPMDDFRKFLEHASGIISKLKGGSSPKRKRRHG